MCSERCIHIHHCYNLSPIATAPLNKHFPPTATHTICLNLIYGKSDSLISIYISCVGYQTITVATDSVCVWMKESRRGNFMHFTEGRDGDRMSCSSTVRPSWDQNQRRLKLTVWIYIWSIFFGLPAVVSSDCRRCCFFFFLIFTTFYHPERILHQWDMNVTFWYKGKQLGLYSSPHVCLTSLTLIDFKVAKH